MVDSLNISEMECSQSCYSSHIPPSSLKMVCYRVLDFKLLKILLLLLMYRQSQLCQRTFHLPSLHGLLLQYCSQNHLRQDFRAMLCFCYAWCFEAIDNFLRKMQIYRDLTLQSHVCIEPGPRQHMEYCYLSRMSYHRYGYSILNLQFLPPPTLLLSQISSIFNIS